MNLLRRAPRLFFSSWRDSRWIFADGGVVILMYHRIGQAPPEARSRALYVAPALFREQMVQLLATGLRALTLDEALPVARAGGRGFCVTFDDGFRSVFVHALPILRELGLRATQFLVAERLGGASDWDAADGEPVEPMMSDDDVRAWLAAGQRIGSHTLTHPRLSDLPAAAARQELADSRARLEDRFSQPVRHFCYPYGDYNERTRELVGAAGYHTACTTDFGANGADTDGLTLRRVLARYRWPSLGSVGVRAWWKLKRAVGIDRQG